MITVNYALKYWGVTSVQRYNDFFNTFTNSQN